MNHPSQYKICVLSHNTVTQVSAFNIHFSNSFTSATLSLRLDNLWMIFYNGLVFAPFTRQPVPSKTLLILWHDFLLGKILYSGWELGELAIWESTCEKSQGKNEMRRIFRNVIWLKKKKDQKDILNCSPLEIFPHFNTPFPGRLES